MLNPGEFIVLASQPYTFKLRYGFDPFGQYSGQLDNSGEQITLVSATGQIIAAVKYNDKLPWPTSADGLGFSIVPVSNNPDTDWNDGANWRASSVIHGTPGADDQGSDIPEVWVNEVLASSDKPEVDFVELYNLNGYDVDISHWFLSDNRKLPKKWQIPAGTVIPARKYLVFYEGVYAGETKTYTANNFGSAFSFSSNGDDVYLFSGNASGGLTGYEHGYEFGESENSISFGKYTTSEKDIHFVLMENQTLGAANSHPKVGPIIVNRIMYHPVDNHFEYIELINVSDTAVELFDLSINRGWRVSGVNFDFARGVSIQSGESVYLTESAIHPEDFRRMMGISQQTQIFNYSGKLDNAGERIEIRKPAPSYTKVEEDTTYVVYPYVVVETINYNDKAPWPDADGNGFALKRKVQTRYANDPANWIALPAGISVQNFILANAVEGVQYQHQFLASGGLSPYVWNIVAGSLPTGLTLDASKGTISGIPVQNGAFSFKMLVADQFGVDVPIEISLNVNVNTLPVAVNDTISTQELFSATVYVFENDIDNDGEKAQWGLNVVSNPKHGTFEINKDQSITYLPNNGFTGTDELTYRIIDYKGTAEAKVVINVEPEVLTGNVLVGISQASDDAEENIYSHNFWANSSDIEMVYDPNPGGDQIVGFRFAQVAVPAGAIITRAYIQFKSDQVSSQSVSLVVNAEAASNPSTFSSSNLISSRVLTSASVNWEPEAWNMIGETSEKQQTPNLSALVSEVVKHDNWQSGNAMAFIISGTGTRVAVAYDKDPEGAAQLCIEYRTASDEATVPFAIADVSETVIINNMVELFGFDSYSSDGRNLNYEWSLVSKPNNSHSDLLNRYLANPTFIPDSYGTYTLSLVVNNGVYSSEEAIVEVVVTNSQPVANAGYDQQKKVGDQIILNGSNSYDPEGEAIEFSWLLVEKPEGSNAYIDGVKLEKPLLVTDMAGIYRVHLVVNDGVSNSAPDEAVVEVGINLKPVAVVNVNQEVYTGELVQLSGDGSYDPEDKNISYTWSVLSKPTNSNLVLSNNSGKSPSFIADSKGVYTFSLVVSDGVNQSDAVETMVTVINNNPPVADAGENLQIDKGQKVTFNGTNSYDPDGTQLSYLWTFITKPEDSKASLSNYAIAEPTFIPDKDGLYTLRLQVSDGIASSFDDVQLVVNPLNSITTFSSDLTMRVYPNPFGERLYIETQRVETSAITCQLFTTSGMLLEQIELYPNGTSTHQLRFDHSRLHEGIYLLTVKSDKSEPQTVRVVYRKMND
ncbi:MAG TPA: lamin tail domain-containing protein [Prolixibacteraceae bacterium]|nr:lamin tail domain-containing protein [Prolixibacteraceae bacterium]